MTTVIDIIIRKKEITMKMMTGTINLLEVKGVKIIISMLINILKGKGVTLEMRGTLIETDLYQEIIRLELFQRKNHFNLTEIRETGIIFSVFYLSSKASLLMKFYSVHYLNLENWHLKGEYRFDMI